MPLLLAVAAGIGAGAPGGCFRLDGRSWRIRPQLQKSLCHFFAREKQPPAVRGGTARGRRCGPCGRRAPRRGGVLVEGLVCGLHGGRVAGALGLARGARVRVVGVRATPNFPTEGVGYWRRRRPRATWTQVSWPSPLSRGPLEGGLAKQPAGAPQEGVSRRTDVVSIVPNWDAVRWLIGAVLAEQYDEWPVARSYPSTLVAGDGDQPSMEASIEASMMIPAGAA